MSDELTDTEMDTIWDEAWVDAINGSPLMDRYPDDHRKIAFYEHAYRMNYAKENGY